MHIEQSSEPSIDYFRLPKRVLMADARVTKNALLRLILSTTKPRLAIDMSDVEFLDSSGLAVLVKCLQMSRRRSGDVCLYGMRDTTTALFELTRLYDVFPIAKGRRGAVEKLSS